MGEVRAGHRDAFDLGVFLTVVGAVMLALARSRCRASRIRSDGRPRRVNGFEPTDFPLRTAGEETH
jgi:hypothetical protein